MKLNQVGGGGGGGEAEKEKGGEKSAKGLTLVGSTSARRWRGKTLGRGGVRKHITGGEHIGAPSIRRIARRAGVKRIGAGCYEKTRLCLEDYLKRVLRDVVVLVEHADRFTCTVMDVVFALKRNGQVLYGYGDVYPQTRGQRVTKLRNKIVLSNEESESIITGSQQQQQQQQQQLQDKEGEEEEGEEEVSMDMNVLMEIVQKKLADYFLRERTDICKIQTVLAEINRLVAKQVSQETLRACLQILQKKNCIMCSSDDIYLI